MLCQENNKENKNCGHTHQSHIAPSNHNTTLSGCMWSSSQALIFRHIPFVAAHSLITPNQLQKCFQKAVTESWELHSHQIHPGITIQARRTAGRCGGCLQEAARLKGKKGGGGERGERHTSISSPLLPSGSAQLCSTCGEDGTGPAGSNMPS